MIFDLHHYYHVDPTLVRLLDRIESKLDQLLAKETQMNADLQTRLDDLNTKVSDEKTVEDSAVALLNGLSGEIAALKSTTTDPATLAAIDALAASVSKNTADLSAAVAANTPAATA